MAPPSFAGKGVGGLGAILRAERGCVVWAGLTDNYLRVLTAAPAGMDLHNRITPARLLRVEGDALWGETMTG